MYPVPLVFVLNQGQQPAEVRYVARDRSSAIELTTDGWRLERAGARALGLRFRGAAAAPAIEGERPQPGMVNYFCGRDPARWRTNIPTFSEVRYRNLYPGIDVRYYFSGREFEYDFIVRPGADPRRIQFQLDRTRLSRPDPAGDLVIDSRTRLRRPVAYQEIGGRRVIRRAEWTVSGNRARFRMGPWDRSRPLIIDPVLAFSTYLGGAEAEYPTSLAVDSAGFIYVTGGTFSTDFPTANALQSANRGDEDVFLAKLDPTGSTLIYSTYLGGTSRDEAYGLAVDAQGNAYVAGSTYSVDFPVTGGAFQTFNAAYANNGFTGFVAKLNPQGDALVYSTFFGGSTGERIYGITVDADGSAYFTGFTYSSDFPMRNALQSSLRGINDGFVAKLDPTGSFIVYSTYLGGAGQDIPTAIALDSTGSAVVTGATDSTDFPTVNAFQPALRNGPVSKTSDAGQHWNISAGGIVPAIQSKQVSPSTVQSMAIDPVTTSTLYAGSWSGVFKSTDGGATWSAQMNGLTSYEPVFTLAVNPANPAIVYAGTERDMFRSVDGANTWQAIDNGFNDRSFQMLAIDPANPATVFTATPFRLYKTTNGGDLWTDLTATLPNRATVISMAIGPTLYAGIGISAPQGQRPGGGVYASTDGGQSWTSTALNDSPVNSVAIDPRNPAVVYAGSFFGGFMKSVDGGATWNIAFAVMGNQPVGFIWIDPSDSTHLIVLTERGIYESHDAAGTWSAVPYVGPAIRALAIDPANSATRYVGASVPPIGTVSKLSADGSRLLWSTYFGGRVQEETNGVAIDSAGNAIVAGFAQSPDIATAGSYQPVLHGVSDAFIAKFTPAGSLSWCTYLGGGQNESVQGVAVDTRGDIWLAGNTGSGDFPTVNPLQLHIQETVGIGNTAMIAELDPTGSNLLFSTYLGGSIFDLGQSIALDPGGAVYVLGQTASQDFPVTPGAFATQMNNGAGMRDLSSDAFVVRIAPVPAGAPQISFGGVRNAASQIASAQVAPGELIQIAGSDLGPDGTSLMIGGISAPVLSATPALIEAMVPWEVSGSSAIVEVRRNGARSNTLVPNVVATDPGIFTQDGSGKGQAAALNQDYTVNSPRNPAPRGTVVMLFGTGGGLTNPPQTDGATATGPAPVVASRVVAAIGGMAATVNYAGTAPGLISGEIQVNVTIPDNAPVGDAVPVLVGIGNLSSVGTTIAVQ